MADNNHVIESIKWTEEEAPSVDAMLHAMARDLVDTLLAKIVHQLRYPTSTHHPSVAGALEVGLRGEKCLLVVTAGLVPVASIDTYAQSLPVDLRAALDFKGRTGSEEEKIDG